jgi:hypothetical protein
MRRSALSLIRPAHGHAALSSHRVRHAVFMMRPVEVWRWCTAVGMAESWCPQLPCTTISSILQWLKAQGGQATGQHSSFCST